MFDMDVSIGSRGSGANPSVLVYPRFCGAAKCVCMSIRKTNVRKTVTRGFNMRKRRNFPYRKSLKPWGPQKSTSLEGFYGSHNLV